MPNTFLFCFYACSHLFTCWWVAPFIIIYCFSLVFTCFVITLLYFSICFLLLSLLLFCHFPLHILRRIVIMKITYSLERYIIGLPSFFFFLPSFSLFVFIVVYYEERYFIYFHYIEPYIYDFICKRAQKILLYAMPHIYFHIYKRKSIYNFVIIYIYFWRAQSLRFFFPFLAQQ